MSIKINQILQKYETMKTDYRIIRNFGPSIFKVIIPEMIVNNINKYVDEVIKDKARSKKQNAGESLVGDVTQEIQLETDFMDKVGWTNFLEKCTTKWIELAMDKKITKFKVIESWVVRQFENEYNPLHWHSGHISGAGFLKVPKSLGAHTQQKSKVDYFGGQLELAHGTKMFMCQSTFPIRPKVGEFYFFPNYMMHTVYPFKNSNQERRSISFNALVDESVYNVYGKEVEKI